jgi:GNAT superfamily N-acetyltransferase
MEITAASIQPIRIPALERHPGYSTAYVKMKCVPCLKPKLFSLGSMHRKVSNTRMFSIAITVSNQDIERCYPVMLELRPHLKQEEFVEQVRAQEQAGFRLASLEVTGEIKAVAGFRILQNLAWGKFMYVDDLVTRSPDANKGYGSALFDWLVRYARSQDCHQFHLDSGVQRYEAHRFYLHKGMAITSHHFAMKFK